MSSRLPYKLVDKLLYKLGFVRKAEVEELLAKQREEISKQLTLFTKNLNQEIDETLETKISSLTRKASQSIQRGKEEAQAGLEQLLKQAKQELKLRQEDKTNVQSSIGWLKRDLKTATDRIKTLEETTYQVNGKELLPNKNIVITSEEIPLALTSKEAKETSLRQYVDKSMKILNQNQKVTVSNTEKLIEQSKEETSPKLKQAIQDIEKLKNPVIKRRVIQKDFNELFDSVNMKLKKLK